MLSNGQQAADFIPILFDTIKAAGLPTQVACCDNDGWEAQRGLLPGIQAAGAEQYLGIVTSHGYSSPPGTPFNTTKRVWETEWSTFDGLNYAWYNYGGQSEGLTWANHVLSGYGMRYLIEPNQEKIDRKLTHRSNISAMGYWWGVSSPFAPAIHLVQKVLAAKAVFFDQWHGALLGRGRHSQSSSSNTLPGSQQHRQRRYVIPDMM